jgi:hypothetical protein
MISETYELAKKEAVNLKKDTLCMLDTLREAVRTKNRFCLNMKEFLFWINDKQDRCGKMLIQLEARIKEAKGNDYRMRYALYKRYSLLYTVLSGARGITEILLDTPKHEWADGKAEWEIAVWIQRLRNNGRYVAKATIEQNIEYEG